MVAVDHFHMGANYLLKVINGKWKISIICALSLKNYRYLELFNYENKVNHNKVTKKVLSEQLHQLENDGIVVKHNYGTVPPKVVYSLTTIGKKLAQKMVELNFIGETIAKNGQQKNDVIFDISADNVKRLHDNAGSN